MWSSFCLHLWNLGCIMIEKNCVFCLFNSSQNQKLMFLLSRNARYLEELVTHLLRNCSRPCRRSSIKESSNIPSSPRNGSCLNRAFPGRGGTTTYLKYKNFIHITHISAITGLLQSLQTSLPELQNNFQSNDWKSITLTCFKLKWTVTTTTRKDDKMPHSEHSYTMLHPNQHFISFIYPSPCFLSPALL